MSSTGGTTTPTVSSSQYLSSSTCHRWLLVLCLSLVSCGVRTASQPHGNTHAYPRPAIIDQSLGSGSTTLQLLVEPNDGVGALVKAIDKAQNRILVTAYILSQSRIVRALERAAAQGVDVYVLLEPHPFGLGLQPVTMFVLLHAANIHVRWSVPGFVYTHAKYMVLDDRVLILSSANFTRAGFARDRDFVLIDHEPSDIREASNLFRADWDRIAPTLGDPNLLVSPFNARAKLRALIQRAHHSLSIYAEEVIDPAMVRALVLAEQRGVHVHIIAATISLRARQTLATADIHPRRLMMPYIHAKVILVDNTLAFVGSENLSATSLDRNREFGVVVRNSAIVSRLAHIFAHDWHASR
jgi:cardiolipin synthase